MPETHELTIEGVKLTVGGTYYPEDEEGPAWFDLDTVKTRCGDDITALCADLDLESKVMELIKDQQRGDRAENEAMKRDERGN